MGFKKEMTIEEASVLSCIRCWDFSALLSQQKHLQETHSVESSLTATPGEGLSLLLRFVLPWLWKPDEISVSVTANRTCQVFSKMFPTRRKETSSYRGDPGVLESKALQAGENPVLYFTGQQRCSKTSSRSSLLEPHLISGGVLRGVMALRRIVLLTLCCPGCAGEDPGHKKA